MYISWRDVAMLSVAALCGGFCINLGGDAYYALFGLIEFCRG